MLAGGDVCIECWFSGLSRCSAWDLSDCLNTGPTVKHCSAAVGTEHTAGFTSTTSGAAQLGSSAGHGCSPGRLSSLQPPVSIIVTSSLGEQCQSLERQKEGKRKKDREKDRNNLFILACADCQPETAKGNVECVRCSVRTSWVIHDVLCENASCVLCGSCSFLFFLFSSLTLFFPPSFSLSFLPLLLSRAQSLLFSSVTKYSLVVKC